MELGKLGSPSSQGAQRSTGPKFRQIKIDHAGGVFYIPGDDDASAKLGRSIQIIGLGLIRTRVYWTGRESSLRGKDAASSRVACRSSDGVEGAPTDKFPWEESEFSNVASNAKLPCTSCSFKGWFSGEKQPRCNSTWNIPAVVPDLRENSTQEHEIFIMPFTASSIPNLEEYMIPLRDTGTPLYRSATRVALKKVSKGDRNWAKAEFQAGIPTYDRDWPGFSAMLHQVRDYMQPKSEGGGFTPLPMR